MYLYNTVYRLLIIFIYLIAVRCCHINQHTAVRNQIIPLPLMVIVPFFLKPKSDSDSVVSARIQRGCTAVTPNARISANIYFFMCFLLSLSFYRKN